MFAHKDLINHKHI